MNLSKKKFIGVAFVMMILPIMVIAQTSPTMEVYQVWGENGGQGDGRVTVLGKLNTYGTYGIPDQMYAIIKAQDNSFNKSVSLNSPIYKSGDSRNSKGYYQLETVTVPKTGYYYVTVGIRVEGHLFVSNQHTSYVTVKTTTVNLSLPSNNQQIKVGDLINIGATITPGANFMWYNVYIKNSNNTEVYKKEQNKGSNFSDSWNSTNYPAGTYTVWIVPYKTDYTEDNGKTSRTFSLISKPTSVNLNSPSSQYTAGQSINFVATVTPGTDFMWYNVYIKNSNNTAVYTKERNASNNFSDSWNSTNYPAGTYTIWIVPYKKDYTEDNGKISKSFTLIAQSKPTSVSLSSFLSQYTAGQSINFSATVTPGTDFMWYNVYIKDSNNNIAYKKEQNTINNFNDSWNSTNYPAGTYTVWIVPYKKDYTEDNGKTSKTFTLIAQSKPTNVNMSSLLSQYTVGQSINFGASVTSGTDFMWYNVYIKNSNNSQVYAKEKQIGNNFSDSWNSTNYPAGTYTVWIVPYKKDYTEDSKTSRTFTLIAKPTPPTSVNMSSLLSPYTAGQSINIVATITPGADFMWYNVYIKDSNNNVVYKKEQNRSINFNDSWNSTSSPAGTYTVWIVPYKSDYTEDNGKTSKTFSLLAAPIANEPGGRGTVLVPTSLIPDVGAILKSTSGTHTTTSQTFTTSNYTKIGSAALRNDGSHNYIGDINATNGFQFTVNSNSARTASLSITYRTDPNRWGKLIVNGVAQNISFDRTGWSSWGTKTIQMSLRQGTNTIAFYGGYPTTNDYAPDVADITVN